MTVIKNELGLTSDALEPDKVSEHRDLRGLFFLWRLKSVALLLTYTESLGNADVSQWIVRI